MSEHITLPANGTNVAVDVVGGDAYQRIKITWGVDGTADDVSLTKPMPVQNVGTVTPRVGSADHITTGGTPIVIVTGPIISGYVTNPPNEVGQNISVAENLYLDMIGIPGSDDTGAHGTTSVLVPGQSFEIPPLATGVTLKANAASSGHRFTIVVW